ncbi:hypothetical protein [Corynebacterium glutamicum]|uniref:hypothetical protein n=1 Tax=Corynebacterium glutamicum TaxID=1718 RepID=UPI000944E2B8|nr:hypothetical protein [Corynebacterium glutamicum]OKX80414.1 hypothetical protein AUO95_09640 [Corynebacterium glutamicum]
MSYDFVLFETDGDPGSARISKTPLTERIDFATPSTTPVLESLAAGLAETVPDTVKLEEDAIYLSGDRCLYVVTNYNSAEEAAAWLTAIAFDYGLGLADMNADTILLFGDEDSDAVVQIDDWFSPAFSAYGLPHLLVEVMRLKDSKTPYLRVTLAADDSKFIQTLYETDNKQWLVETSSSTGTDESHVKTINDVLERIETWFNQETAV